MKRILSVVSMLIVVVSCTAIVSANARGKRDAAFSGGGAQTGVRQRKPRRIIGGAAGTGARARTTRTNRRGAIGAGGAGTYVRNGQRGRYVTRNGKRIWVPQGSPVVEREQLPAVRKKPSRQ